jgi:hypothetical protein
VKAKGEDKDLLVFISHRESKCDDCGEDLGMHACRKYSGRVGRSASAKALDEDAVRLAVIAHIRHRHTRYDGLPARGYDRADARAEVRDAVAKVLEKWEARGR